MKKFGLVVGVLVVILIVGVIVGLSFYKSNLEAVSNSDNKVIFSIKEGDSYYSIGEELEKKGLIRSKDVYKIYLKLNTPKDNLKVGDYYLSPNMTVEEIIKTLGGRGIINDIVITFKEGKNMRYIAKTIASNTNNKESDVYDLLKDKDYLNELINEYWFIDESVLNDKIYYSLEGYLYPNTYNFKNKDVTIKEIFKVMLDETEKKVEPYKNDILNSKYSFHQLLTLGSIIELEALNISDRDMVSSVFYNRLNSGMSLGSDVTTYYAAKVDMSERDLYMSEINDVNAYNTRSATMAGKLPVGPICNPSISSFKAALKPKSSNYYYFVADKNGKVYYTKNSVEHNQVIAKLKSEGLWYTY